MDFVVVGLGVGALAVLLGLILRGGRGRWRSSREDRPVPPAATARGRAIGRACRAGGAVLSVAGAVVLAVTVIALLLGLSDRAGAILVMLAVSVTALGGIAWAILYTHRYHPRPRTRTGWQRDGRDTERREDEPPSLAGTIAAGVARLGAAPVAEAPRPDPVAPATDDPRSFTDQAPEQAPAAMDSAVTETAGAAATATDAAAPAGAATAPATDQPAATPAPELEPAPPDEPPEDAAPAPATVSVAAGSHRRA